MKQLLSKVTTSLGFWEAIAKGCNWLLLASLPLFIAEDTYGTVALLASYLLFISNVGVIGQNSVILRYVNKDNFDTLPYNFALSSVMTLVMFVIAIYLFQIDVRFLTELLLAAILFSSYTLYIAFARKTYDTHRYARVRVGYALMRLLLGLLLLVYFQEPVYYLYAEIVALIIGLVIVRTRSSKVTLPSLSLSSPALVRSVKFGTPLIIHSLAAYGLAFSDRIILSLFYTEDVVGRYAAIYTYAASVTFVYTILAVKWEPEVYTADTVDQAQSRANIFVKQCLGYGSITGLLTMLFYYVVFVLFMGVEVQAMLTFAVILFAHFLTPLYFKMNYLLAHLEKTTYISLSAIIAGAVNIASNFFLIPRYGINGAATTTVISYIVLFLLLTYFYRINKEGRS